MKASALNATILKRYPPGLDGYVRVRLSDGDLVPEHRLVMARALNRPLNRWEIVRHSNNDKTDNTLSNLLLEELGEEGGGKRRPRQVSLVCSCCGKPFSRPTKLVNLSFKRGKTDFYCNRKCVGKRYGRGSKSALKD